ncbi:alpha-N-acetylgalactosaminide alpha-2,6-sialyltransferase 6-like isoform X2 [Engraulis encrasicolus]|uniref:alpha-N-acetylgalactosaminide alpha-2,6-sialyltransferase 6-like isoform X2 n=1 Tax=Engraulis encrasicolus TaxID=184585 RepID=UPI002FD5F492
MGFLLVDKGHQNQRMVVFGAIFLLTTLLILYSSNSGSQLYFSVGASNHHYVSKNTNLKTWSTRDTYVPVYGNKTFSLHCGHCALVTSSSHVLGSGAGREIDGSECVIRMNDAPTSGFERDVGNRTTLRVVAHSSVFRVVRRPAEFLNLSTTDMSVVFWGPPTKIGRDAKGTLFRLIQRVSATYRNVSFYTITPSKMKKFDSLFQRETGRDREKSRSWLSTGWFTMVIAIELCDNIKVYGMVPPNYCGRKQSKRMPYHYYKPRGSDECAMYLQNERGRRGNHHRFITEKQVFSRWAKHYNITFSTPTW